MTPLFARLPDVNVEEPLDIPLFPWVSEALHSLRSHSYYSLRSIKGTEKGTKSAECSPSKLGTAAQSNSPI